MKRNAVARWVIAGSLFVAGSCAPVSQGVLAGPNAPFDTAAAEKTLVFGFNSIVERHLDRVTAGSVAVEGMRGLASIDPEIGIAQVDDRLLLTASDRVVAEYPAPDQNDVQAWARMTITLALDARGISQAMQNTDIEQIYEAVFDSTLAKLDMFSRYSGAKEAADHRASRNGFGGVGLRFELEEGEAKVIEVMADAPAAKAGLAVGDILTHIDGRSVAGLEKEAISHRLRGAVASEVLVGLRRGLKPMEISIHRALIVPPTVTASLRPDGIAEFRITSFNQRTAASLATELRHARDTLGAAMKGVILDMRGNPGGLLDQAVSMADLFIADGPIVSTRGRHPLATQAYEARQGDMAEDLPVVVLVDGKSASAAEILAAALQDAGRAVVVGTNSYGKGTVQTVLRLPNDGEMTLTWSRFHTPTGYALHGLGVLPTICTADETVTPGGLMEGVIHAAMPSPVTANLSLWRHAGLEQTDLRKRLRATCPSAKHAESKVDLELAEKILTDNGFYTRALQLSSPRSAPSAADAGPSTLIQQVSH